MTLCVWCLHKTAIGRTLVCNNHEFCVDCMTTFQMAGLTECLACGSSQEVKVCGSSQEVKVVEEVGACIICLDKYIQPLAVPCGHVFCTGCITTWTQTSTSCPVCRTAIPTVAPINCALLSPIYQFPRVISPPPIRSIRRKQRSRLERLNSRLRCSAVVKSGKNRGNVCGKKVERHSFGHCGYHRTR